MFKKDLQEIIKEVIREEEKTSKRGKKGHPLGRKFSPQCAYFGWDHKELPPLKGIIDFVKANPKSQVFTIDLGDQINILLGPSEEELIDFLKTSKDSPVHGMIDDPSTDDTDFDIQPYND